MEEKEKNNRWHASWIIAAIVALTVTAITTWAGLNMTASILLILLGAGLSTVLLWILTPIAVHRVVKIIASLAIAASASLGIWWVYQNDRPVLRLQIRSMAGRNLTNGTGFDIEAFVKNSGQQQGSADTWKMTLTVDGSATDGKEIFSQVLTQSESSGPDLYGADFPSGKPVRGWLFFQFPSASLDSLRPYFTCGSDLLNKVTIRVSVWESKFQREFSDTKQLKDLGYCIPPIITPPPQVKPATKKRPYIGLFLPPYDPRSDVLRAVAISYKNTHSAYPSNVMELYSYISNELKKQHQQFTVGISSENVIAIFPQVQPPEQSTPVNPTVDISGNGVINLGDIDIESNSPGGALRMNNNDRVTQTGSIKVNGIVKPKQASPGQKPEANDATMPPPSSQK